MLVCISFVHVAHETAGAARIRHSLRPLIGEGESYLQTSGATRRENAATYPTVIVRLDRTTQYSRDADDRTDKPRRTGSPAFAGDDSLVWGDTIPVIASEAKQSILSFGGEMDCFRLRSSSYGGQVAALAMTVLREVQ